MIEFKSGDEIFFRMPNGDKRKGFITHMNEMKTECHAELYRKDSKYGNENMRYIPMRILKKVVRIAK